MAIYDTGTASLAANGQVTGVGTQWTMPLTLIRVGATLVFKTEPVQIYTISEITSDTSMAVYNPNGETVPAGTGYAILAHDGISVQGLAQDVAETLRYYQSRETEVATAVDAFKNFDANEFSSKVSQVNTQYGEVVSISSQVASDAQQVASDAQQVSLDKDSAASSALSASNYKDDAAASAQEAADSAASLDAQNLLRKDLSLSDLTDKSLSRQNLDVYSKSEVDSRTNITTLLGFNSPDRLVVHKDPSKLQILARTFEVSCPQNSSTAFTWQWVTYDSQAPFDGNPVISCDLLAPGSGSIRAGVENLTNSLASGYIKNDNSSTVVARVNLIAIGKTL